MKFLPSIKGHGGFDCKPIMLCNLAFLLLIYIVLYSSFFPSRTASFKGRQFQSLCLISLALSLSKCLLGRDLRCLSAFLVLKTWPVADFFQALYGAPASMAVSVYIGKNNPLRDATHFWGPPSCKMSPGAPAFAQIRLVSRTGWTKEPTERWCWYQVTGTGLLCNHRTFPSWLRDRWGGCFVNTLKCSTSVCL